jgi:tRNA threonylcarbamoyladenosine biosynthesis protein TsaB
MANILNIETSSKICSVSIFHKTEQLGYAVAEEEFTHARDLTSLISDSLKTAGLKLTDLDAVAVNAGPGSYTALRVGYSVAKGLCFGSDLKMLAHTSFEILYDQAKHSDQFLGCDCIIPMIDARRDEVYMLAYNNDGSEVIDAQSFILDEEVLKKSIGTKKNILVIGDAAKKAKSFLNSSDFKFQELEITAIHMAYISWEKYQLEKWENVAYTIPFYLKPPNIVASKKKYF